MNKQIWKYTLDVYDSAIEMPIGAEVLTVQSQNNIPCLWALVNPLAEKEKRYFEVFGTGHNVYCDMGIERMYIGTFQIDSGSLVFHLFERLQ